MKIVLIFLVSILISGCESYAEHSKINEHLKLTSVATPAHNKIPEIVEQYSKSVAFVKIICTFRDKDTKKIWRYGINSPSKVQIGGKGKPQTKFVYGSAFIVKDNILVTNAHVTHGACKQYATTFTSDNTEVNTTSVQLYFQGYKGPFEGRVLYKDTVLDLALILAKKLPNKLKPIPIYQKKIRIGERVLSIGFPSGLSGIALRMSEKEAINLSKRYDDNTLEKLLAKSNRIKPTVTAGIVSWAEKKIIAYDAESTNGSSGGVVINQYGYAIAITTYAVVRSIHLTLGIPTTYVLKLIEKYEDEQ